MSRPLRQLFLAALLIRSASAETVWQPGPEETAAFHRIDAASMRGHVSFLASDALEGRATPSRGLDIAAEYIASQFRRAGLEPVAPKGSYFQTADFVQFTQRLEEAHVVLRAGTEEVTLKSSEFRIAGDKAIDVKANPVPASAENIADKVVFGGSAPIGREQLMKLRERKPQLILLFSLRRLPRAPDIIDADEVIGSIPVLTIFNNKAADLARGKQPVELIVHAGAPGVTHVFARNVAGILRGSDPILKDQYVVLSAHYDHVGMKPDGPGDRIFNGANDNASGTASVVEIAAALASMQIHPKRSILFLTFFGEEKGLLGAYYYTRHPLVPLANTVADLNLEQMGRVDGQTGKKLLSFALIGAALSNAGSIVEASAQSVGIHIFHEADEDSYFTRSDHFALAEAGVVSLTAAVTFEFPDYHAVGDEWEKLDYSNMEKVDRAIAAAIVHLSDRTDAPHWNQTPETAPYRKKGS